MSVLVFAEHDGARVTEATRRAISAATTLGTPVDVVVAGGEEAASVAESLAVAGVNRVWLCLGAIYADQLAEPLAERVSRLIQDEGYQALVAATSTQARDLLPRIAAALDVQMLSDVIAIEDTETFVRPIHGGSVLARLRCREPVKVLTVRATRFERPEAGDLPAVERLEAGTESGPTRLLEEHGSASDRPDLASARVVVAGGRGVADVGIEELEALADQLGAAIGASRGAVEAGLLPNEAQVGLTAKVVAPELYIAAGISGAIYHVSGMKDSGVIVAINKDPEAPIFEVADYGLVADLREALPALRTALEQA
ncbi:electron transfer flavoprotein subunit alpha/FixB family protein [Halorhodospira halophila]|uniref:Electron transfer flavoprotein subunit alpha n=1 Tax=Halorhodospira halophila (strain DSM 244 / SL1) TaxID=349124 RepID=A1WX49_HALHL|nr:electron transfer flavoprotein subunit alpha/FixB family protein [Halorhodospira halophila]ABM62261.1 electron transfer flavoprotein, alpha subunit [Halorhodospira halophila SL1]MBK1729236.1 electron transfer flavoprotein subunit alpha/FixB family protein [Halorhodospira halophila]